MSTIIIRPVITEKSLKLAASGVYTFMVMLDANKKEIASEVHKLFKVHVENVKTLKVHGKIRRSGKKMIKKKQSDWKKAYVGVRKGESIEAFQVSNEEENKKV